MGSGASVLCGGRPTLQLQCADLRMAWCNGLVVYEDGTVRSIDNDNDMPDFVIGEVDNDEIEFEFSTDDDYDHEISDPEAETEAVAQLNVYWISQEYDRN